MRTNAVWACAVFLGFAGACASSDDESATTTPIESVDAGGADATDAGPRLSLDLVAACTDSIDAVYTYTDPLPPGAEARGDILRCATEASISQADVAAKLAESGYVGRAPTSGAKVYRVLYRTERGDAASTPSVSSALVLLPDTPRNAGHLPVVVVARGTRGQGAACAASKRDPKGDEGLHALMYPLVGLGFAVIVPDFAGYANFGMPGNPPSAYAQADDIARSTLDGGRALKKLVPGLDPGVVLVGHSQGGFAALAALSRSDTYGTAGPILGVAAYAPLWLSQRSWGAVLNPIVAAGYPFSESIAGPVSIWYHYTEAELLDGPGEGVKLFRAEARAAVKAFVETECLGDSYPGLEAIGANAADLFDPSFIQSVADAAAFGNKCTDAVCEKWSARYREDRPHLSAAAAKTPIFMLYGNADTTIPPDRVTCALDRLRADNANLTMCIDPDATHGSILERKADLAADWIAHVSLGEAAPPACALAEARSIVKDGFPATCATPPPND